MVSLFYYDLWMDMRPAPCFCSVSFQHWGNCQIHCLVFYLVRLYWSMLLRMLQRLCPISLEQPKELPASQLMIRPCTSSREPPRYLLLWSFCTAHHKLVARFDQVHSKDQGYSQIFLNYVCCSKCCFYLYTVFKEQSPNGYIATEMVPNPQTK